MRILLISARYLPHRGGLESVVYHLAHEFRQQGHTVQIVTNRYPRTLPAREEIDRIQVIRLHFLLPDLLYLRNTRFDLWLAGVWYRFYTVQVLRRIIYEFQPDIINSHYLNEVAEFTGRSLANRFPAIPWVISLHGGDVNGEPLLSSSKMGLFKTAAKRADRLTACSNVLARQAIDLVPEAISNIVVIHNGVDVQKFSHASPYPFQRPFILALGQLVEHKGFDLLINGFSQIMESFRPIDLVIAGEGPYRSRLEELIIQKKLGNQVHLLGRVDEDLASRLMAGCLFLAMPSRRESFGIVALEAMASGKRVMASPIAGIWDFLPREPNWQVELSPGAWASALRDVLDSGNFGVCLENLEAAAKMDWSEVAGKYMEIYRQVLKQ